MGWVTQVFSLQLRKTMSYRFDFWVQFIVPTLLQLCISYFLWRAVFEAQGVSQIAGYDLPSLMLYYFFVFMSARITSNGEWRAIMAEEIYDGSLSKYLLYPVSFYAYKVASSAADSLFAVVQTLLGLGLYLWIVGKPAGIFLGPGSIAMGVVAALVASQLSIILGALVDMCAFWADNVWSLQVVLRFFVNFGGGGLIPLALFPAQVGHILKFSPFACLVSFPVQSFLGKLSWVQWGGFLGLTLAWWTVFAALAYGMWRKGLRQYSGTGL